MRAWITTPAIPTSNDAENIISVSNTLYKTTRIGIFTQLGFRGVIALKLHHP